MSVLATRVREPAPAWLGPGFESSNLGGTFFTPIAVEGNGAGETPRALRQTLRPICAIIRAPFARVGALTPGESRTTMKLERWFPALAVGLSLVLRLVYFLQIRDNPYFTAPVMDEGYHDLWAREIAAGDWESRLPFFRAPLYPFLLGFAYKLFGADPVPFGLLRGAQLFLGAITPWLTYLLGRRLLPSRPGVAMVASLLVACDGLLWYFEADLLLEALLAPLGTALLLVLLWAGDNASPRRWFVCGLVLGLFAITRPNILLFAPVGFLLALGWRDSTYSWRPPRFAAALALTAGTCLLVLPITAVNWARGGDRVLVASQAGLNFFLGNGPEANGWSATAPSMFRVDWWGGYEDAIELAEQGEGRKLLPSEVSKYWFHETFDFWRENPRAAATIMVRKLSYLFSGLEFANNRDIRLFMRDWGPLALPSYYWFYVIMPLALLGAGFVWRAEDWRGKAVVALVVAYSVSIILFFVTARYRVPIRPVLMLLAVEGARRVLVGWNQRDLRVLAAAGAALVLAVVVNTTPWAREYDPSPSQYYQAIANIHREAGNLPKALEYQLRVLETEPAYPEGNLNLGTMYMSQGNVAAAVEAFERERRYDPTDGKNLASLAAALGRLGRLEEAEARYAEAEATGLLDPPVLYNRALLLERLDRTAAAETQYRKVVATDSTFVEAWNNLGVLLARTDRLEEAASCWREVVRLAPEHANANANLRRAEELLGPGERTPSDTRE